MKFDRWMVATAVTGMVICFGFAIAAQEEDRITTLQNYSFCQGVWNAQRVLAQGIVPAPTNGFDNGANYFMLLHAARHHAITNGQVRFDSRSGFKGDE